MHNINTKRLKDNSEYRKSTNCVPLYIKVHCFANLQGEQERERTDDKISQVHLPDFDRYPGADHQDNQLEKETTGKRPEYLNRLSFSHHYTQPQKDRHYNHKSEGDSGKFHRVKSRASNSDGDRERYNENACYSGFNYFSSDLFSSSARLSAAR